MSLKEIALAGLDALDPTIDPQVSNALLKAEKGRLDGALQDSNSSSGDSEHHGTHAPDAPDQNASGAANANSNQTDNTREDDEDDFRSAPGSPASNSPDSNTAKANGDNVNLDIDDELSSTAALLRSHGVFFNASQNAPVPFYVPQGEQDRDNIISLIERNGGKIDNELPAYVVSDHAYGSRLTLRPTFIYDCIKHHVFLPAEDYYAKDSSSADHNATAVAAAAALAGTSAAESLAAAINHSRNSHDALHHGGHANGGHTNNDGLTSAQLAMELVRNQSDAPASVIAINKNGFTKVEDDFILEEVRKNPKRRATHKLFHEIAEKLQRHTGNSVRYRFRKHLQNELRYVYKTDSKGNLLHDANGHYIFTEIMPSTVKNKFTSEDDYILCKAVLQKAEVHGADGERSISLPNKFFESLEADQPHHSKAAWRDRFRKFARQYGIDNYIKYYEACIAQGKVPQPMKNYTARAKLDAVKGASRISRPSSASLPPSHFTDNASASASLDDFNDLISHSGNSAGVIGSIQDGRQVKRQKVASSNNNDTSAAGESLEAGNIFSEENGLAELESNFVSQNAILSANPSQIPLINKQSSLGISELLNPETLGRFFSKDYFHYSLSKVLTKVNEIVSRDYSTTGADLLLDSLNNELGINKSFGTEILTNCCGDLSLVSKYINLVINTGKNPPENVSGIWTRDDDARLQRMDANKDDRNYLLAKHGEERIDLRKQFINSI